jgi:lipopolysaccharide biosynthesis glycosyltransferase
VVHDPSHNTQLEIHLAISPTPGFLNRLRYLITSWQLYGNPGLTHRFVVTVGADQEPQDLTNRAPWITSFPISWRWFDRDLFRRHSWWGTINDRFRAEFAAEHVLMLDADTVFARPIGDAFAFLPEDGGIAGVPAYETPFRNLPPGESPLGWWRHLFASVELDQPVFDFVHSATGTPCPAYYNNAFLLMTAATATHLGRVIFEEMENCERMIGRHPFRDQIALTLSIYRLGLPAISLPLRFNHFIGETAVTSARKEWEEARVIHYTSNDFFHSETDGASAESVERWLNRTASGYFDGLRARFRELISSVHDRLVAKQSGQTRILAIVIRAGNDCAALARSALACLAFGRMNWQKWQPRLRVFIPDGADPELLRKWLPYLRDATVVLEPASIPRDDLLCCGRGHSLIDWAPADVIMQMSANTLPVAELEDILDYVFETGSIAGVIARDPFPAWPDISSREAWNRVSEDLTRSPLAFNYTYTLSMSDTPEPNRATPFYVHDGPLFIPGSYFRDLTERFMYLCPTVVSRLPIRDAVQSVAMALAIAEIGARTCALPIRYNFPIDPRAEAFPEELNDVQLFDYGATAEYDLSKVFDSADQYFDFTRATLPSISGFFRQRVRDLLGAEYPFGASAREFAVSTPSFNWREVLKTAAGIKSFKRALISEFGVKPGFALYRETLKQPDIEEIHLKPVQSQYQFAKTGGDFFLEWAKAGEPLLIEPPVIIGEASPRSINGVSRSAYVACLREAQVRGASGLIQVDGVGLFDFQASELERFDWEMDIDPSIFQACNESAWIVTARDQRATMRIDEAFMLLGPQTGGFGDWMQDYLPRYVAANLSGALPPVPVLIDASLPAVHRASIELMLPDGVELITVPGLTTVRVDRLWCAPALFYAPSWEKMDSRFSYAHRAPPPARFAAVTQEMARRSDDAIRESASPERIFLARRNSLWRNLVNSNNIEAAAKVYDFSIVSPEEFDFAGQVNLVRNARFVIVPEGSAVCLAYFARPGMKMCILNHTLVEWPIIYNSFLSGVGVDLTIMTGPIIRRHPEFPDRADYTIDERGFCEFLNGWLAT